MSPVNWLTYIFKSFVANLHEVLYINVETCYVQNFNARLENIFVDGIHSLDFSLCSIVKKPNLEIGQNKTTLTRPPYIEQFCTVNNLVYHTL